VNIPGANDTTRTSCSRHSRVRQVCSVVGCSSPGRAGGR